MIPRSYVENFTRGINAISEQARPALEVTLEGIDLTGDVADVRRQVVSVMQGICGTSTDAAAQLAAQFYDGLRYYEIGETMGAQPISGREAEATEGAVRAFADKLVKGNPDAFVNLLRDRVDYEIKVAASNTCLNNAKRDRRKPRFARVPTGIETCDFCLMLASRGFVYYTEAAASHAHGGCDCRIVPSWKSQEVEGYDPEAIYDQWQDAIKAKSAERAERNGTTEADEMRKIMDAYGASAAKAKGRTRPSTENNDAVNARISDFEKATSMDELKKLIESTNLEGLSERQVTGLQNAVKRARMRLK